MVNGNYAEGTSLNTNQGYYTERIAEYDKNGNIKKLRRKAGNIMVDSLNYSYPAKSNKISTITDYGTATTEIDDYPGNSQTYIYDTNGNMTYDGARNLNVYYINTLNLPIEVLHSSTDNKVFYHYTTGGIKLIKHFDPASGYGTEATTHYIGNIVYEEGKLSYIITDEGRLVPFGTGAERLFVFEYNLKDHLGNNRVTFTGTNLGGTVDIVQTTSYYPFGLVLKQVNGNTAPTYQKNKYLYNGKELQDESLAGVNLDLYDFQTRFYDPQIGRWTTPDPLSEVNRKWSPYRFAYDNPLRFIDPDGMLEDDFIFNEKGCFVRKEENNRPDKIVVENSETGNKKSYEFNDPKNDSKTLDYLTKKYGDKTQLLFTKTSEDISGYIEKSGVNSSFAQEHPLSYAYKESQNQGDMDNWARYLGQEMVNAGISKPDIDADRGGFFVTNGSNKAFNAMDFGNAVWGLEMMHLGFSLNTAKAGAHGHQLLIEKVRYRRGGLLDSPGDQKAIKSGYNTFSSGGAGGNW